MKAVVGKVYRHFKGNRYVVIAIAMDVAIVGRRLVIYAEVDGDERKVWAREITEFEGVHESGVERFVEENP